MSFLLFLSPIVGLIILAAGIFLYIKSDDEDGGLGPMLTMIGALLVILPMFLIMFFRVGFGG